MNLDAAATAGGSAIGAGESAVSRRLSERRSQPAWVLPVAIGGAAGAVLIVAAIVGVIALLNSAVGEVAKGGAKPADRPFPEVGAAVVDEHSTREPRLTEEPWSGAGGGDLSTRGEDLVSEPWTSIPGADRRFDTEAEPPGRRQQQLNGDAPVFDFDSAGMTRPVDGRAVPVRRSLRLWTDRSGGFQIEASYVGMEGEEVILVRADGGHMRVPLRDLSSADVEYVESLRQR